MAISCRTCDRQGQQELALLEGDIWRKLGARPATNAHALHLADSTNLFLRLPCMVPRWAARAQAGSHLFETGAGFGHAPGRVPHRAFRGGENHLRRCSSKGTLHSEAFDLSAHEDLWLLCKTFRQPQLLCLSEREGGSPYNQTGPIRPAPFAADGYQGQRSQQVCPSPARTDPRIGGHEGEMGQRV